MSHEKMKDLMARLVAMSPEPPPYPEETTMARHREPRRSRPALVFVGAAVVVVALAAPLLLFTGGQAPDVIATTMPTTPASTTAAPATSTTADVTTTTEGTTETTQAVLPVWSRPIFLYQTPENSFGESPALVPVWIELTPMSPDAEFTEALTAMGSDLPDGLENAIPAEVAIMGTQLEDGVWTAEMNEAFLDGAGGLLADVTMLNQLVYTITAGTTAEQVRFLVNGEPVEAFGSEGLVLTDPVGRDDFLDQVHAINVTDPIVQTEDGWTVRGIARVFEASLVVNVIDGDGNRTYEDFVTASCGSDCWGDFQIDLDSALITPGESSIRLFQYSAEDGSAVDMITVPIPQDGIWQVTLDG